MIYIDGRGNNKVTEVCSVGSQDVKQEQLFDEYQKAQQDFKAAS
ncbi:hypothetical protein [Acinetobacter oleivorans]|nr:hypothetical protein [Acinetobacter oleivorans]